MVRSGAVPVRIGARFALADAAQAHRALEARATTGSTLLMP
jgi:NADPH2:quinone reductase